MCSMGAFGGGLRCPAYAVGLPRPELVETLKDQVRYRWCTARPAMECGATLHASDSVT